MLPSVLAITHVYVVAFFYYVSRYNAASMNEYAVHEMLNCSVELRRVICVRHIHCSVRRVISRFPNTVFVLISAHAPISAQPGRFRNTRA